VRCGAAMVVRKASEGAASSWWGQGPRPRTRREKAVYPQISHCFFHGPFSTGSRLGYNAAAFRP
jgi:hypothetical protein